MTNESSSNPKGRLPGLRRMLEQAKTDVQDLGGVAVFKTGEWVWALIHKSFKSYFENANRDYFRSKYKTNNSNFIADKIINVAAMNAAALGALTGLAISGDELLTLFTGGEFGVGLPANIAIAISAVAAEAVLFLRMQLQLIAELAKVYDVPLNTDDPEDALLILAFALGGGAAEEAGKLGMKIGGNLTEKAVRDIIQKDTLRGLQSIGRKIGLKILQRDIIKYAVPVASTVIGALWNRTTIISVGNIAKKHMRERKRSLQKASKNLGKSKRS